MTLPSHNTETAYPPADKSEKLRGLFKQVMCDVDVRAAVKKEISCVGEELRVGGLRCNIEELDQVLIIALGKAANQMYLGALEALCLALPKDCRVEAVVVSPFASPIREHTLFCEGAHPTPDLRSVHAADTILGKLKGVDARTAVIFLVSGGTSSMIERPIVPSISIEDLALFYGQLIDSGLGIEEMNIVRKHLSAVKGGRLAQVASHARFVCTLIVSDVPNGASASVGSGPSIPDASTRADCRRILRGLAAREDIPPSIEAFFASPAFVDTPSPDDAAFAHNSWRGVLSSIDLAAAACAAASDVGFYAVVDNTCDEWDYISAARYLLERATQLRTQHRRFCLISVGEVSVQVIGPSGRGGRNQQFALWCATELCRRSLDFAVLSAGSDGIDGRSPAAGAVVDSTTCERARLYGLDLSHSLSRFDAYTVFEALGDSICTGPTGNNLRDLRIVMSS